jgi:hypothetical protein
MIENPTKRRASETKGFNRKRNNQQEADNQRNQPRLCMKNSRAIKNGSRQNQCQAMQQFTVDFLGS